MLPGELVELFLQNDVVLGARAVDERVLRLVSRVGEGGDDAPVDLDLVLILLFLYILEVRKRGEFFSSSLVLCLSLSKKKKTHWYIGVIPVPPAMQPMCFHLFVVIGI